MIMHLDMDAFYASVEQLDNPGLRDACLVVGGDTRRGVVAAASYAARRYGIHSAMPIFQARQKCPDLVIVPPRRDRYVELSRKIMALLEDISPLVEQISIDEAYVDISGCARLHGTSRKIARTIKSKIRLEIGLTASVGIAPNKFLAKIASDLHKPDGLTIIEPDQVAAFIEQLPIQKVPGVGPKAADKLVQRGIFTLGQVNRAPSELIARLFGKFGARLIALSQGRDDSPVVPHGEAKSLSSETTLAENTRDRTLLAALLLTQAQSVAHQLRAHRLVARTVTLKLKGADFQRHDHSRTECKPLRASEAIYEAALSLLDGVALVQPVRLIGVAVSGLRPDTLPVQQALFGDTRETVHRKWEKIDQAMDDVTRRYGRQAVVRGAQASSDERLK
jgi:DNA polymerase-4